MKKAMTYLIIPIIITIIGSLVAVYFEYYLQEKDEKTDTAPVLTISSDRDNLMITNNTTNVLYVRVAYSIVAGGSTTHCYPNGDQESDDSLLGPGATETFATKSCRNINGYKVWAWNNQRELVFEAEG